MPTAGRPARRRAASSSALRLSATVNRGRSVGGTAGSARCGAHLSQSQAAQSRRHRRTARSGTRMGACQVIACRTIAVAICRQATGLPSSRTRANDRSDSATGSVADGAVGAQESAQRDRRNDVDVLERLGLAELQIEGECLVAETEAHRGEIGIGRPALPQSAGADQRLQSARVGMQPEQRLGLVRGGGPGLAPDLRKVPEVVAPLAGDPAGAIAADPGQLATGHGQRRNPEHHPGGDVRTGAAGGEDQCHRAEPTERRAAPSARWTCRRTAVPAAPAAGGPRPVAITIGGGSRRAGRRNITTATVFPRSCCRAALAR